MTLMNMYKIQNLGIEGSDEKIKCKIGYRENLH